MLGTRWRLGERITIGHDPTVRSAIAPLRSSDGRLRQSRLGGRSWLDSQNKWTTHRGQVTEALALSDRIVVMHEGRIEGIDSPYDLYNFPSSRYIATFIGDANLVDGRIADISDSGVSVESVVGSWTLPRDRIRIGGTITIGQAVSVVIRPEQVLVDPSRSNDHD